LGRPHIVFLHIWAALRLVGSHGERGGKWRKEGGNYNFLHHFFLCIHIQINDDHGETVHQPAIPVFHEIQTQFKITLHLSQLQVIIRAFVSPISHLRPPFLTYHTTQSPSTHLRTSPHRRFSEDLPPPPVDPHQPLSAYVHLPFCKKKCKYCDFPIIAVGMNSNAEKVQDNMSQYIHTLLKEIAATRPLNDQPLQTIFFGGGTPSLISISGLEAIISALDREFGISSSAEISIEADPGTFDRSTLGSYLSLGVTRVSVGAQAFQDELLSICGRAHNVADIYRAIDAIYAAGVPSWSLDLMSGLPNLTVEDWQASIEAVIDASPNHVSVYDLQVEEGTPFAKLYSPGMAPLPEDEDAANMYALASQSLRGASGGGYEHYEVSNYARPGHRCAHNMTYWTGKPFYAFGLGATSYLKYIRYARPKRIGAYTKWVEEEYAVGTERRVPGEEGGKMIPPESKEERLLDMVMLSLRLKDGLDIERMKEEYGSDVKKRVMNALQPHIEEGRAELVEEKKESGKEVRRIVKLTDPEGFLLSNDIISDIFSFIEEKE